MSYFLKSLEFILEADTSRRDFLKASASGIFTALSGIGFPSTISTPLAKGKKLFLNIIASEAIGRDLGSTNLEKSLSDINILFNALSKVNANMFRSSEDDDIDYQFSTSLSADQILELSKMGFDFHISENGDEGSIQNGPLEVKLLFSMDKDDIFYFDDYYKIKHPLLDFWNNFARFDPFSAVNYPDTIAKLRKVFGGYIKPPVFMGDIQGMALNDNIHKIDSWDSFDKEVSELKNRAHGSGENESDLALSPYDDYDDLAKDRWSSEGGLSEHADNLIDKLINEGITLSEAFDKINILCKEDSTNQVIKISLLSHFID